MPRLKHKPPSYSLHKASGQAVVKLDGRSHYLGAYGSPESHAAYRRLIAEWAVARPLATVPKQSPEEIRADLRVNELLVAYLEFARGYYVKDGRPTGRSARALHFPTDLRHPPRRCTFQPAFIGSVRSSPNASAAARFEACRSLSKPSSRSSIRTTKIPNRSSGPPT